MDGIRIPNLVLDLTSNSPVSKYGRMRKHFLELQHEGSLTAFVLSNKLTIHLSEIDPTAREQVESTVSKMASLEGVTERLKAENQME